MSRIIAVSEAVREAYLERGWETAERILTVHNGIDFEPATGRGAELRRELGIKPGTQVVAMVTVLREGKGHDLAAGAIAEILESDPERDILLLVAGDGPAREEVEKALEPLGERAMMIGHRDEVGPVLDAANLLVHPSLGEALPTALIEAMAAGTPTVATRIGGIPELIEDGESGLLIPGPEQPALTAAIRSMLEGPQPGGAMAGSARRRYLEHFTVSAWMDRLLPAYEEVLAAHSSS